MNDILPLQTAYWTYLEDVLSQVASSYGYRQIRFPFLENTSLFKRTIGEVTDIVEKEMYTFEDRNGESISLRPEGTAGCVRAGIEHGLLYNQHQRLCYLGPMFRYEKPQFGRFRQFYQFGVEAFGIADPAIDAEQILMMARILEMLNLQDQVTLQINSLGNACSRELYREKLIGYFNENIDVLDDDSLRRLNSNPLRILDSKNEAMQLMLSAAPRMLDYLDESSKLHFNKLRSLLDAANLNYTLNSRIVRGLDYYNMTVYEWTTDRLGSQGTICAGGRYDNLVEYLGGKSTPAVGYAVGLERIVALLETTFTPDADPHVYVITVGGESCEHALIMSEKIRRQFPEIRVVTDYSGGSLKNQLRRADKSGAKLALINGQDEVSRNSVTLKYLRESKPQITVDYNTLCQLLLQALVE